MNRGVIVGIIIGLVVIGVLGFYLFSYGSEEEAEVFCPDYDGNQEGCLLHSECKWIDEESICNSLNSSDDGDNEDNEESGSSGGFNQELEEIKIPDNPSNEICKQLPLSGNPPYAKRYHCLALVNHDERFCEGIDEENAKNICLAHAKKDSSYCENLGEVDSRHVCYFMLAVSSDNIEFCKDIDYLNTADENKEEKLRCYYNFISNLYQWGRSEDIKTEYCNEFPSDYEDRDTCFALKERDLSLCNNITNCLTHFEQPLSFCDDYTDFVSCIKDRAKTSENVSICELLSQPDRDSCIGVYCTHIELNVNICDKIENVEKKEEFYIELAMNLMNND